MSPPAAVKQQRFPRGKAPLQLLPQEVIETVAEFCGDVASISPNEQTDTFLHDVIHPHLDSAASNTWQPAYRDLQALALASKTFTNPAQRAFYKVAMVKTTCDLMRLLRSLLLYLHNRRYVRYFVANIEDHPAASASARPVAIPSDRSRQASRSRTPPIYATLLDNHHHLRLKSLSLDFGVLLSLTNIKRYVPGYPTGLPPSVERLTLVGNETRSELSYHFFDLDIFAKWLRTNSRLRELRMLHGFDKLVAYKRFNDTQTQRNNWNSILLRYKDTLEVLVVDWYRPFSLFPETRFGPSKILDCLPQMQKLQYLRVPLHALGASEWSDPLGEMKWNFLGLMPDDLPPRCRKMDLMSLTLDFGAIYSLINLKSHVPGYPTGYPPSIERLTLVGNRVGSELPYEACTIEFFSAWLSTNQKLRELKLVDDFDKMVRYTDSCRDTNNANSNSEPVKRLNNWNGILLAYKDTLEVLVMGSWHRPSAIGMKARFGPSGHA
ncbi:hypothetical protein N0V85_005668 [Neurospora sp. IMI 360204]|nr:hypothetical protein N0V85_005668 [Neurospora sp. IMI 360204]